MVKIANNEKVKAFVGLSSDVKPTQANGFVLDDGSTFLELDTQDTYLYYTTVSGGTLVETWKKVDTSKIQIIFNAR